MSRLNDAKPADWDSVHAAMYLRNRPHGTELTFGEHKEAKALDTQVGGSHYQHFPIQPVEFSIANGLGFCEGNVIKYVCRYKMKGGKEDLLKAKHYIELLMESEDAKRST